MKPTQKNVFSQLFFSVFKLSACTFGGGFVIIPLMKKCFVEDLGWIEEQEMLDMTAIAQSSPGAIAVNAAILIGYHIAGIPGALLTVLGTTLPPMIIISIISLFYQAVRDNIAINWIMTGMLCGVAAVILNVVIDMATPIFQKKSFLSISLLFGTFIAIRLFSINVIAVILVCGCIGAWSTYHQEHFLRKSVKHDLH